MSASVLTAPAVVASDRQAEVSPLDAAIAELLRRGFYCRVSRRIDASLLRFWQRLAYVHFCRRLPLKRKVPAVPPLERGGFPSFTAAVAWCSSTDDLLEVFPWNWAYGGESVDVGVACRPRDPLDSARYERLRAVFGDRTTEAEGDVIRDIRRDVEDCRETVRHLRV